jgi:ketosteroid isomerase-like protein
MIMTIATAHRTSGLTVEDRLDIAELIARFAHCSDYGDWDGLASLYRDDVVTEMDGQTIRYTGIAEQVAHARESDAQAQGKNRHYNFNLMIETDGDTIKARYAFMNVNAGRAPMSAKIVVTGRMSDTVVKTPQGWKIAHRHVSFDQSFGLDF